MNEQKLESAFWLNSTYLDIDSVLITESLERQEGDLSINFTLMRSPVHWKRSKRSRWCMLPCKQVLVRVLLTVEGWLRVMGSCCCKLASARGQGLAGFYGQITPAGRWHNYAIMWTKSMFFHWRLFKCSCISVKI